MFLYKQRWARGFREVYLNYGMDYEWTDGMEYQLTKISVLCVICKFTFDLT